MRVGFFVLIFETKLNSEMSTPIGYSVKALPMVGHCTTEV
jgi:hypothetical protein